MRRTTRRATPRRPARPLLVVALAAASGLVAAPAAAQLAPERPWHVGLAGGVSLPTGEYVDDVDLATGFAVLGYVGYQPARQAVGFRLELDYARHGLELPPALDDGVDLAVSQLGGAANVVLTVSNDGSFRPYVIGGAGVYRVRESTDPVLADGIAFTSSQTRLGLNGGVGARFRLGALSGLLEARFKSVLLEDDRTFNTLPIVIGFEF